MHFNCKFKKCAEVFISDNSVTYWQNCFPKFWATWSTSETFVYVARYLTPLLPQTVSCRCWWYNRTKSVFTVDITVFTAENLISMNAAVIMFEYFVNVQHVSGADCHCISDAVRNRCGCQLMFTVQHDGVLSPVQRCHQPSNVWPIWTGTNESLRVCHRVIPTASILSFTDVGQNAAPTAKP